MVLAYRRLEGGGVVLAYRRLEGGGVVLAYRRLEGGGVVLAYCSFVLLSTSDPLTLAS